MSYTTEEKKAIAGTLLNQIGSKALVMIGARNFGYATDKNENVYVSFRVGRNVPRISFVKITYNSGTDLYDIEYLDREGRVMDSDENFYGDQLATALGHHLKMAVSLGAEENTKQLSANFFRDIIEKVEPSILIDYLAQAYFDKAQKFSIAKGSNKSYLYNTAYKKLIKVSSDMFDIE